MTGVTALALGIVLAVRRPPRWLVVAWNALGSTLLVAIASIAVLATPLFRAFGEAALNVWVVDFPYVWMIVMVASALIGHVVLGRKLMLERDVARGTRAD